MKALAQYDAHILGQQGQAEGLPTGRDTDAIDGSLCDRVDDGDVPTQVVSRALHTVARQDHLLPCSLVHIVAAIAHRASVGWVLTDNLHAQQASMSACLIVMTWTLCHVTVS